MHPTANWQTRHTGAIAKLHEPQSRATAAAAASAINGHMVFASVSGWLFFEQDFSVFREQQEHLLKSQNVYLHERIHAIPERKNEPYPLEANHHRPQEQDERVRVVELHGLGAVLEEHPHVDGSYQEQA